MHIFHDCARPCLQSAVHVTAQMELCASNCNHFVVKSGRMRLIAGCLQLLPHLTCQSGSIRFIKDQHRQPIAVNVSSS